MLHLLILFYKKILSFREKSPLKSPHRSRLEDISFTAALPPKIPYDFWIRYHLGELSYPQIGKDSLRENHPAQATLPFVEISGKDRRYYSLPAQ